MPTIPTPCWRSSAAGRSRTRRARSYGDSGSTDAVLLPGRLEIRDWLERANIFVHTSRWEGFGIVLLEAMLAALPIVATRVSAVPEVVADGATGILVEPGDVSGLSESLSRLLADPDHAARPRAGGPRAGSIGVLGRQDATRRSPSTGRSDDAATADRRAV